MVLGPFAGLISMTITLVIQAGLGDEGITIFGVNVFNMAVIGVMSFFIVKAFLSRGFTSKRLALGNVCCFLHLKRMNSIGGGCRDWTFSDGWHPWRYNRDCSFNAYGVCSNWDY
jgi:hypothetical protein